MSKKNIQKKSLKRNTQKTRKLQSEKKKGGFLFGLFGKKVDSDTVKVLKEKQESCRREIQKQIDAQIEIEKKTPATTAPAPGATPGDATAPGAAPAPPATTAPDATTAPAQSGGKKRNNKTKKNKK